MVQGVAGDGQTPTLDGVGEHDTRPIGHGIASLIRAQKFPDVVAAEVLHQRCKFPVAERGHELPDVVMGAVEESGAKFRAPEGEQALVLLVGHRVDVAPQRLAAGLRERGLKAATVLRLLDVPSRVSEELHQQVRLHLRHDPIEALTVHVDDPGDVGQILERGVRNRLPHIPLVELGIADQGEEATRAGRGEVRVDVAAGCGREQRRDRAEAHRTGGEVRDVRVLGATRVGLQPPEAAKTGEVGPIELTGQVLDGVVHRRGMWLDRDLVVAVEMAEPERRHDRDHRRTGRLVTADLDAAGVRPIVIRVVDHPHRQPQHPLLDLLDRGDVRPKRRHRRGVHGRRHAEA